jgi:hypothetical protein
MSAGLFTTAPRPPLTPSSSRRGAFSAGDNRAGVTHPSPRRRGLSRDEADDRLFERRLDKGGGVLFRIAADLADENDRFRFLVRGKEAQRVNERRADQRIAADADAGGLAEPSSVS